MGRRTSKSPQISYCVHNCIRLRNNTLTLTHDTCPKKRYFIDKRVLTLVLGTTSGGLPSSKVLKNSFLVIISPLYSFQAYHCLNGARSKHTMFLIILRTTMCLAVNLCHLLPRGRIMDAIRWAMRSLRAGPTAAGQMDALTTGTVSTIVIHHTRYEILSLACSRCGIVIQF